MKTRSKIIILVVCLSILMVSTVVPCFANSYNLDNLLENRVSQYLGLPFDIIWSDITSDNENLVARSNEFGALVYKQNIAQTSTGNKYTNTIWDTYFEPNSYRKIRNYISMHTYDTSREWDFSPNNLQVTSSVAGLAYYNTLLLYGKTQMPSSSTVIASNALDYFYEFGTSSGSLFDPEFDFARLYNLQYTGVISTNNLNLSRSQFMPKYLYLTIAVPEGTYDVDAYIYDIFDLPFDIHCEYDLFTVNSSNVIDWEPKLINVYSLTANNSPYIRWFYNPDTFMLGYGRALTAYTSDIMGEGIEFAYCEINLDAMYNEIIQDSGSDTYIRNLSFYAMPMNDTLGSSDPTPFPDFFKSNSWIQDFQISSAYNSLPVHSVSLYYEGVVPSSINSGRDSVAFAQGSFDNDRHDFDLVEAPTDIVSWLGNAFGPIFEIDIIGNISLGDVLLVALGAGFVLLVLKFFAGG